MSDYGVCDAALSNFIFQRLASIKKLKTPLYKPENQRMLVLSGTLAISASNALFFRERSLAKFRDFFPRLHYNLD